MPQPGLRITRIERQIRAAGFENAENSATHQRRAFHKNSDRRVRRDAEFSQVMSDLIRLSVNFRVSKIIAVVSNGYIVRSACRLNLEKLVETLVGKFRCRFVPFNQQLTSLGFTQ